MKSKITSKLRVFYGLKLKKAEKSKLKFLFKYVIKDKSL